MAVKTIFTAALIACLAVPALAADAPAPSTPALEVEFMIMPMSDYELVISALKAGRAYIENQRREILKLKTGKCA